MAERKTGFSHLSAPVFDGTGHPLWELQAGPLRPAVPPEEREHYIRESKNTAAELSSIQQQR